MDFRIKKYYSMVLVLFIALNIVSVYFFIKYRQNVNTSKSISTVKIEYSEIRERIKESHLIALELKDSSLSMMSDSLLNQHELDSLLETSTISENQMADIRIRLDELKEKSLELDKALSSN